MTCVAGYTNGKNWAIAGDSGLFESGDTNIWWPTRDPKVWRVGDSLLGYAGSGLAHAVARNSGLSDAVKLAEVLKEAMGDKPDQDFDILIVNKSSLWRIGEDFIAEKITRKYHAIGGAAGPAWGVLHYGSSAKHPPAAVVEGAVAAACEVHLWAIKPVKVLSL